MFDTLAHVLPRQSEHERCRIMLLPSALYHENAKITRSDWTRVHEAHDDPVQRAFMHTTERRLAESYDLILQGSKHYPHASQIALPAVPPLLQRDLGEVIRQRRSRRLFNGEVITLAELACLLAYSYGVTRYEERSGQHLSRRAVPSGGALYPLEVYVLALQVEALPAGAYHYNVYTHALELLTAGDLHAVLRENFLYAELALGPAVVILLSGVFSRPRFKYGELGYRLTLLEAGHVGQNLSLTTTALGLGCCPVEGFVEDGFNDLLGLDGVDETVLYLMVIGKAAGAAAGKEA